MKTRSPPVLMALLARIASNPKPYILWSRIFMRRAPYPRPYYCPTLYTRGGNCVWRVSTCRQGGTTISHRVDVKQAAEKLGISSEGIRQRIRRGTLRSEKDTDGRVYVFLEGEDSKGSQSERDTDDVLTRFESEVEFLRQELATRDAEIQRRDAILLSMSEGLKALNPPTPEAPESPLRASADTGNGEAYGDQERRSWLYRFFFGPG